MSGEDRRLSPRQAVDLAVSVETRAGARSEGRMTSLSRLGALIEGHELLDVGALVRLVLAQEGEAPLELRAQVIRAEAVGEVQALGVMFAPLPPVTLARVDGLLARFRGPSD